jgi:hypothetical protein
MIEIFRENGEIVLSIGSAYRSVDFLKTSLRVFRAYNQAIYGASDLGIAIDMLPDSQDLSNSSDHVISLFPRYSPTHLCQPDLIFMFRLISLQTSHLLQSSTGFHDMNERWQSETRNFERNKFSMVQGNEDFENIVEEMEENLGGSKSVRNTKTCCERVLPSFDLLRCTGCVGSNNSTLRAGSQAISHAPLNLRGLLEAIRKGRVFLLNGFQVMIYTFVIHLLNHRFWHLQR